MFVDNFDGSQYLVAISIFPSQHSIYQLCDFSNQVPSFLV